MDRELTPRELRAIEDRAADGIPDRWLTIDPEEFGKEKPVTISARELVYLVRDREFLLAEVRRLRRLNPS